jgi:hypothetical protein
MLNIKINIKEACERFWTGFMGLGRVSEGEGGSVVNTTVDAGIALNRKYHGKISNYQLFKWNSSQCS